MFIAFMAASRVRDEGVRARIALAVARSFETESGQA